MKKRLIEQCDRFFSLLVRSKKYCERCGTTGQALECSHIFSRRYYFLRWRADNAMCLCRECHAWWHANPHEAMAWAESKIGKGKVDSLRLEANEVAKFQVSDLRILKQTLKTEVKKAQNVKKG